MDDFQTMFPKRIVVCKESLDVRRIQNVAYINAQGVALHCDVYLPKETSGDDTHPVVFMVHGEAPIPGLKEMGCYISYCELIASKGMAAVTFNHRTIMGGATINEVLADIAHARDHMRTHAADFNIDPSRSCVFALSAGMPFAAYNALSDNPAEVKCFVGLYGLGDFRSLLSVLPDRRDLSQLIPEIITGRITFPMLIVRAGLDMTLFSDSVDRFILQCLNMNADMDVYCHSTGHHAFDILDDNQRSHELIGNTMNFMHKHLLDA